MSISNGGGGGGGNHGMNKDCTLLNIFPNVFT